MRSKQRKNIHTVRKQVNEHKKNDKGILVMMLKGDPLEHRDETARLKGEG